MTRTDRRRLLQRLAFSKSRHFSWDKFPANTMAYDNAKGGPNLEACRLYNIENLHEVAWCAGGTTWVDEMKAMEEGNELNPTAC